MKVMKLQDIENAIKKIKPELEQKFGIKKIGIFGSYSKGLANEESDIDLIVDIKHPIGLIRFIQIEQYLTDILNRKVDLLTFQGIKPYIKQDILKDIKYV